MLRSAIAALAFSGLAAPAFAAAFTFETTNPVTEKRVIAESVVWTCEGTVCRGDLDRKAPSVRICKKIAKEVGEIASLSNGKVSLTAEELTECNTAAKK